MSSTNEELSPPKPRVSPLDYRNTDLVSRLLAATPPYLYNMPLVPHSYFFSEMLRSFVQAKSQENRVPATIPTNPVTVGPTQHRRSRKRAWSQMKLEQWQNKSDFPYKQSEQKDNNNAWMTKLSPTERKSPILEKPLELTTNSKLTNSKISHKISDLEKSSDPKSEVHGHYEKSELQTPPANNHLLPFSNIVSDNGQQSDLILPPPPPMWYPPLYPAPYGIDPLHFFIDLRVSGHIYDRKKEAINSPLQPPTNFLLTPPLNDPSQPKEFPASTEMPEHFHLARESLFKQTRHASAFTVPNRNGPINLSNDRDDVKRLKLSDDIGEGKFRHENKISTNYVMQNLKKIYHSTSEQSKPESCRQDSSEASKNSKDDETEKPDDENEDQKPKPGCKDLSALIGLELVVDYVKQEKPSKNVNGDAKTVRMESPDLEIVESQNSY